MARIEIVICNRCGAHSQPSAPGWGPSGWASVRVPGAEVNGDLCPACMASFNAWWEKRERPDRPSLEVVK